MEPKTFERNGPGRTNLAEVGPSVGPRAPRLDGEDVRGAEPRETDSFEELVQEHLTILYSAALRMTRNRADAEDLVQDTLERAHRAFHRYRAESKARAWLGCIMRNLWITDRRRHRDGFHTIPLDALAEAPPEPATFDAPDDCDVEAVVLETLGVDAIVSAIGRLPGHLREVVVLADLGEVPYRAIAEMLDVPVGTVASRLSRGRQRLRGVLGDQARAVGFLARAS